MIMKKNINNELENYNNLKEESAKGVQKGGNPLLFMGLGYNKNSIDDSWYIYI